MKKAEDETPIWEKDLLTVREAAAYTNIGIEKMYEIAKQPHRNLVDREGKKELIRRKELEKLINRSKRI